MKLPSLRTLIAEKISLADLLDEIDKSLVEEALDEAECNITEAARLLGIGRGAIQGKMKKYGIEIVHSSRKAA